LQELKKDKLPTDKGFIVIVTFEEDSDKSQNIGWLVINNLAIVGPATGKGKGEEKSPRSRPLTYSKSTWN